MDIEKELAASLPAIIALSGHSLQDVCRALAACLQAAGMLAEKQRSAFPEEDQVHFPVTETMRLKIAHLAESYQVSYSLACRPARLEQWHAACYVRHEKLNAYQQDLVDTFLLRNEAGEVLYDSKTRLPRLCDAKWLLYFKSADLPVWKQIYTRLEAQMEMECRLFGAPKKQKEKAPQPARSRER